VVRVLLDWAADLNARGKDGRTALVRALSQGHADIVVILLEMDVDLVTRIDSLGISALKN
jgi:ankyrin repeat protein